MADCRITHITKKNRQSTHDHITHAENPHGIGTEKILLRASTIKQTHFMFWKTVIVQM